MGCNMTEITIKKKENVKQIRFLREKGMTLVKLSERFGVSPAQISNIVRGLSWR